MLKKLVNKMIKRETHIEQVMAAPPSHEMLKDKGALVIGGGSGIGYEIARRFIQSGAKVAIAGRNQERLRAASEKLGNIGYIVLDIADTACHRTKLEEAIEKIGGSIDILVNCAGIISEGELKGRKFLQISKQDWDSVMDINLRGTYFLCQKYAQIMTDCKARGKIINVCSITGLKPRLTPYGISKWAEVDITRAMGITLAPYGIIVNGIAPGVVHTGMMEGRMNKSFDNYYDLSSPDRRDACVEDIANIALFLASDYAGHIVGEIITCDGGKTNL